MRLIVHDYKHLKLKQDLLWVGTSTLVTVIFWIAYAVYSSFTKEYSDPLIEQLATPLDPTINQEVLNSLSDRHVPPEPFVVLTVADESGSNAQPGTGFFVQNATTSGNTASSSALGTN